MHCSWYFGDAHDGFFSATNQTSALQTCYNSLIKKLPIQSIILLQQTHGTTGHIVDQQFLQSTPHLYGAYGDFLITQCSNIAIGVLTADCVPLVIVDSSKKIVAVIHAGWRGSLAHIASNVINILTNHYHSSKETLDIYIGPCAGVCCYQVQPDFITNNSQDTLLPTCIIEHPMKEHNQLKNISTLFFDIVLYNKKVLMQNGIPQEHIQTNNHCCTICNQQYHSYRRDATIKRQITLAWIEE